MSATRTYLLDSNVFIEAKVDFLAKADGWLVALARAEGYVLVTHEVSDPRARRKVPIPNVCDAFKVPHANTFDMLRDLDTSFHWHAPASTPPA